LPRCIDGVHHVRSLEAHHRDGRISRGDTEKYLKEAPALDAPLLMHLAGEDEFMSKDAQAQIKTALAGKSKATVYTYSGQRHAFSRHNGEHYNAEAAALANERTSEFLRRTLSLGLTQYLLQERQGATVCGGGEPSVNRLEATSYTAPSGGRAWAR
jgi:carboxymethylenebutenolidase